MGWELIGKEDQRGMSLHELEQIVDRGIAGYVEAGRALAAIKESSAYAQGKSLDGREYATWAEYCVGRFGLSQQHVNNLINAAAVVGQLETETMVSVLPRSERIARPLVKLMGGQRGEDHSDAIPHVWETAIEDAGGPSEVTAKHVAKAVNKYLGKADPDAAFSSDSEEWYTPRKYIASVRRVLGGIDLDPASNPVANEWIGADAYYTANDDGLSQPWHGRVWCNPPYGLDEENQSNQGKWTGRMVSEFEGGHIEAGMMLVTFVPDRTWFQLLWRYPMCAVGRRIQFEKADGSKGGKPVSANVFVYLGEHVQRFCDEFEQYGAILIPRGSLIEVHSK